MPASPELQSVLDRRRALVEPDFQVSAGRPCLQNTTGVATKGGDAVPPLALHLGKFQGVPVAVLAEERTAGMESSAAPDFAAIDCTLHQSSVGSSTCSETSASDLVIFTEFGSSNGTVTRPVMVVKSPTPSPGVGLPKPLRKVTKVQVPKVKEQKLQMTTAYSPARYSPSQAVPGSFCWRCQRQEMANKALEEKVRALEKAEETARGQLQLLQQQQAASLEHINARLAAESENQKRLTTKLSELQQHADFLEEIQCQQAGNSSSTTQNIVLRSPGGGTVGPMGPKTTEKETSMTLGQLNSSTWLPQQGATMPKPTMVVLWEESSDSACSARSVQTGPLHGSLEASQPASLVERCDVPAVLGGLSSQQQQRQRQHKLVPGHEKTPKAASQSAQRRSIAQWVTDAACYVQLRICCRGLGRARRAPLHPNITSISGNRKATVTAMPKLAKRPISPGARSAASEAAR
mmetsp:Transcript_10788/g.20928  ORF Transcript_10788/g.20928 Transcript_10788/m.20928 type:complete len:463 (+) Transcript_10788:83-1471(+)